MSKKKKIILAVFALLMLAAMAARLIRRATPTHKVSHATHAYLGGSASGTTSAPDTITWRDYKKKSQKVRRYFCL